MSRYTDEALMRLAGSSETEVVKAVYPDCPPSKKDRERSAVRGARVELLNRLIEWKRESDVASKVLSMMLDDEHERLVSAKSSIKDLKYQVDESFRLLSLKERELDEKCVDLVRCEIELNAAHAAIESASTGIVSFMFGFPWVVIRAFAIGNHIKNALYVLTHDIERRRKRS